MFIFSDQCDPSKRNKQANKQKKSKNEKQKSKGKWVTGFGFYVVCCWAAKLSPNYKLSCDEIKSFLSDNSRMPFIPCGHYVLLASFHKKESNITPSYIIF